MEYLILRHKEKEERTKLFSLIGEYFASASIRREFGRPMSSDDTYTWIIALYGNSVAAFAALRVARNGNAELCHAYTFPVYRCQGINRKLSEMRLELAHELGAKAIYTTIDPDRLTKYPGFVPHRRKGRWLSIEKRIVCE